MPNWGNKAPGIAELSTEVLGAIRAALPLGWTVEQRRPTPRGASPDLLLEVRSADGARGQVAVEVKRSVIPARVPDFARQLRGYDLPGAAPLLVAPYVGPRARALLREQGIGFWDMAGNAELTLRRPGLAVRLQGALRDPWRMPRSVRSLKGPKAARVVRALCDWRPPQGIRELAGRADVSAGYVSRLLSMLEEDALITRAMPRPTLADRDSGGRTTLERRGPVVSVDWQALLRRWTDDYDLLRSNEVTRWLEPRGLGEFFRRLRATGQTYAITGASSVAATIAAVAPTQLAVCFVESPRSLASELELREVTGAANVFLVRPFDPVLLAGAREIDGISYAAVSQTFADLLTSPGRASGEIDALTQWMERNEPAWRA